MSKPAQWKAKGREFQQKIRNFFCTLGNLEVEVDVASRQMGGIGEDVVFLTEKAKALFGGFYIECKAERKGFNPHKFVENHPLAKGPRHLLLFHKRDRGKALVTMDLRTFLYLLKSNVLQVDEGRMPDTTHPPLREPPMVGEGG